MQAHAGLESESSLCMHAAEESSVTVCHLLIWVPTTQELAQKMGLKNIFFIFYFFVRSWDPSWPKSMSNYAWNAWKTKKKRKLVSSIYYIYLILIFSFSLFSRHFKRNCSLIWARKDLKTEQKNKKYFFRPIFWAGASSCAHDLRVLFYIVCRSYINPCPAKPRSNRATLFNLRYCTPVMTLPMIIQVT